MADTSTANAGTDTVATEDSEDRVTEVRFHRLVHLLITVLADLASIICTHAAVLTVASHTLRMVHLSMAAMVATTPKFTSERHTGQASLNSL